MIYAADPMLTITSKIESVQVYRRGATVVRTAQVDGQPPDEVEFADLPLSLLDPTVRVRVLDAGGADVVAAGVRVGLWVRPGGTPPKAPEQKELEELRRRLRRAREQNGQLTAEIGLLASVPVPERPTGEEGKAPPASPMAARLHLEQFVDEATRQRLAERRKLDDEIRALEEEERRILERIAAASSAAEVHLDELRKSAVAVLRVRGGAPKGLKLELSYVVPGARWAPAYQCKLDRLGSRAEIQLRAWVAQRTGEDWQGVKLRLSTASPLRFTELPELSAVKIGRAQPVAPKKGFRPPPKGGEVLFRDYDRDVARAASLVPPPRPWSAPSLEAAPTLEARMVPRPRPQQHRDGGRMELTKVSYADEAELSVPAPESVDELSEPTPMRATERTMLAAAAAAPAMAPPSPPGGMRSKSAGPGPASPPRPPDDVLMALLYPLLRLPGADNVGGRGRLMPVDARALYVESAGRAGRPVHFDVMSAVRHAEEQASSVQSAPLPEGTVDADDISSHFDFAYEADGLVEVTADGGFHSVALGDRSSEARMRYIAVPREELSVYRVAMLTNPIPAPLLPGPAEVYVGGEYVLTTRLPTVPARGELKLGLGVEQSIKIARNTKYSEVRSGEKVVAMSELVHDIDVDVVNHLEREIEIEVRERVPVPAAGAEVVVEELKIEPAWSAYDQEERGQPIEGGRRWEIKIDKGAQMKLKARYVVKIYANNEVVGGNRREA